MDISKTELKVLEAIWQQYPASASEVVERLQQQGEWHEKTVKTLIGRLVKKQVLSFEKDARRYLYSPLVSQHDYQVEQSNNLIRNAFKGKVSPLIAMFAQNNTLKKEDIAELKQLIDDWENGND